MRHFVLLLSAVSLLAGCSAVPPGSSEKHTGSWLDRTTGMLRNWGGAERKDAYDKEVARLFAQPYIDPLTRYLEQYRNDASRADHLHQVLVERDKRCAAIADRYASRPLTAQTLDQYRSGYSYSCPAQVEAFAERVKAASAAAGTHSDTTSPKNEAANNAEDSQTWGGKYAQQLNDCYLLTTIRNFGEAAHACQLPAEQGDLRAQYNMALISRSLQKYDDALHWARTAQGRSADARYLLGQLYASGQGVARDDHQALHWYRMAAQQGHTAAQYQLGQFLDAGRGAQADPKAARHWYQQAALQGDAEAQMALGSMLLDGRGGARDVAQARYWLLRAARQGLGQAQLQLGSMEQQDDSDSTKLAEAWVWYDLAAQNGVKEGRKRADLLRSGLTPSLLQKAQLRVRQALEGGR